MGWILLMAGFTMTVHLVQLTVVRHIDPTAIQGFRYLFDWQWPSALYAVDTVAWNIFFGLALLFAAPAFHASGHRVVCNGMLIAGTMSVVGIIGPAVNHIALREIGIIGYAIVWPIVCLPLARAFAQPAPIAGAMLPTRAEELQNVSQDDQEQPRPTHPAPGPTDESHVGRLTNIKDAR